eukprot:gene15932-17533_t
MAKDISLLDPSFQAGKDVIKKISFNNQHKVTFYTLVDADFGKTFSLSLTMMLDSHPVVPKKILTVKKSSGSKDIIVLAVTIGASHIKFKYYNKAAMFYITIWPARWERIVLRKTGEIVHLFVNCVKIGSTVLLADRQKDLPNRWLFREAQVIFLGKKQLYTVQGSKKDGLWKKAETSRPEEVIKKAPLQITLGHIRVHIDPSILKQFHGDPKLEDILQMVASGNLKTTKVPLVRHTQRQYPGVQNTAVKTTGITMKPTSIGVKTTTASSAELKLQSTHGISTTSTDSDGRNGLGKTSQSTESQSPITHESTKSSLLGVSSHNPIATARNLSMTSSNPTHIPRTDSNTVSTQSSTTEKNAMQLFPATAIAANLVQNTSHRETFNSSLPTVASSIMTSLESNTSQRSISTVPPTATSEAFSPKPTVEQFWYLRGPAGFKGYPGDVGLMGPEGSVGEKGMKGPKGVQGPLGLKGAPGLIGSQGPPGNKGMFGLPSVHRIGRPGLRGDFGRPGRKGKLGKEGFKGDKGLQGPMGPRGAVGNKGPIGSPGPKGRSGKMGRAGPKGEEGDEGQQGPKGKQGPPGQIGADGPMGVRGVHGKRGSSGPKGFVGDRGFFGDTGDPGLAGRRGKRGPIGPVGPPGSPGLFGTAGKIGPKGEQGEFGSIGFPGRKGAKGIKGHDGNNGEHGDKGRMGAVGDSGYVGDRGRSGERGKQGDRGAKGFPGSRGHKGTQGIPGLPAPPGRPGDMGLPGENGVAGPQGRKGSKGAQGTHGPEGEFGARGPRGQVGDPGSPGYVGEKGFPGDVGEQGLPGKKGTNGAIGARGMKGIKGQMGKRGKIGENGKIGPKGIQGFPGIPGYRGDTGRPGKDGQPGLPGRTGFSGMKGFPVSVDDREEIRFLRLLVMSLNNPRCICCYQGSKGEPGAKGKEGEHGRKGSIGFPGTEGDLGPKGLRGEKGESGLPGVMGPDGEVGLEGDPGPIGPRGKPGRTGLKGFPGSNGRMGTFGPMGLRGIPGRNGGTGGKGKKGDTGKPGNDGFRGLSGRLGDEGEMGRKGEKGLPGEPGTPGKNGKVGATGIPGYPGDIGPEGTAGIAGQRGDKGPLGSIGTKGQLGQTGEPGTPGIPGEPGSNGPTGFDGEEGLVGDKGEKGEAGIPGTLGVTGPKGLKGEVGDIGSPGRPGSQGETGTVGDVGSPGPQGAKGAGGMKGKSGEEGNEGSPGIKGKRGPDGLPGDRGQQGIMGRPGMPGITGRIGKRGSLGRDGPKGKDGKTGEDGDVGIPGKRGAEGSKGQRGEQGANGKKGAAGKKAVNGLQGDQGEPGISGQPGLLGPPGIKGKEGDQGEKGQRGYPGYPGVRGKPGKQGAQGETGPTGPAGLAGVDGSIGEIGDFGESGNTGKQGKSGKQGEKGDVGSIGKKGYPGDMGERGRIGRRGERLPKGPKGFKGRKGYLGTRGARGPKGSPGPPGLSFEPPIYSIVPKGEDLFKFYRGISPAQTPHVIMSHMLTYLSNEIDDIKYPIGSRNNPATTCREVFQNLEEPTDGYFWIDPNRGCPSDAIRVYCEFSTGGKTCIESNSSDLPLKNWNNDKSIRIMHLTKLLGIQKVTYGVRKPQINFLRLLSEEIRQKIIVDCVNYDLVSNFKKKSNLIYVEFIGWNNKIFGSNNIHEINIMQNSCGQTRTGKAEIEISTKRNLKDLPIIDAKITSRGAVKERIGISKIKSLRMGLQLLTVPLKKCALKALLNLNVADVIRSDDVVLSFLREKESRIFDQILGNQVKHLALSTEYCHLSYGEKKQVFDQCQSYTVEHQKAILVLHSHLRGMKVAILTSKEPCSRTFSKSLFNEFVKRNKKFQSADKINITLFSFVKFPLRIFEISSLISNIKISGASVIILICEKSIQEIVLQVAAKHDVIGFGQIWLIPEFQYTIKASLVPMQLITIERLINTKKASLVTEEQILTSFRIVKELLLQGNESMSIGDPGLLSSTTCGSNSYSMVKISIKTSNKSDWTTVYTKAGDSAYKFQANSGLALNLFASTRPMVKFRVVTIFDAPFTTAASYLGRGSGHFFDCERGLICRVSIKNMTESNVTQWRKTCCIGHSIELLQLLMKRINFGVDIYIVEDGYYGSKVDGVFNGLIGDVARKKADFALAGLTITALRSTVVDFTYQFIRQDIGIVTLSTKNELKFINWQFANKIESNVIVAVFVGIILGTILVYWFENEELFSKRFACAARGNYPARYSLREGFTYYSGLTFQRDLGGKNPTKFGSRVAAVAFAFAMLVAMTTYTAVLTATKVTQDDSNQFLGIKDNRMLNPTDDFKFATVPSTSIEGFFKDAPDDNFRRMYFFMKKYNVASVEEGLAKVKSGELQAFIHEYPFLLYFLSKQSECLLKITGQPIGQSGFGLAMQKQSLWRDRFSYEIVRLKEQGVLDDLDKKWLSSGCSDQSGNSFTPQAFSLKYFGGLVLVVSIAFCALLFMLPLEHAFHRYHKVPVRALSRIVSIWRESRQRKMTVQPRPSINSVTTEGNVIQLSSRLS